MAWFFQLLAVLGLTAVVIGVGKTPDDDVFYSDTFGKKFMWGATTSSGQIEGGLNEGGSGASIWDAFLTNRALNPSGDTAEVACDSYHKWREDIELLKHLGVDFYRMSIAWPRLMPDGTLASLNEDGIKYYNDIIDALVAAKIKPMITIYHWDLPQTLQDQGGWQNDNIVNWYADFARLCFERFGDRVPLWITFNEPWIFTYYGHIKATMAPGLKGPYMEGTGFYNISHNIIRSHALAYNIYDTEFRASQKGRVSITLEGPWVEPASDSDEDKAAAERAMQFHVGLYMGPFTTGDYPQVVKDMVAAKSALFGMPQSRLPEFTDEEKELNKGSLDYLGLNHYTSAMGKNQIESGITANFENDDDVNQYPDSDWTRTYVPYMHIVPWGFRRMLKWLSTTYDNIPIIITENGICDDLKNYNNSLQDTYRVNFYNDYINNMLKAIKLDNSNVIGYSVWALLDNLEYGSGYKIRFGLNRVDYTDPDRKRTHKMSAYWYKDLIAKSHSNKPMTKPDFASLQKQLGGAVPPEVKRQQGGSKGPAKIAPRKPIIRGK